MATRPGSTSPASGHWPTHVAASVRKGDPVIVVGRLRTSVWTKDGQTRERLGLEAETVGHDLSRGTAIFRRASRTAVPVEPAGGRWGS